MNFEQYKKMLLGKCSQEETEQVMQWLQEGPAAVEALLAEEAGAIEQQPMPEAIRQQMLAFFEQKGIPAPVETAIIEMDRTGSRKRPWLRWVAAAAIIIGTAAGLLVYTRKSTTLSQEWLIVHHKDTGMKMFTLPDSSTVWLHAQSSVSYREDFDKQAERMVVLTGEAYFKVSAVEEHPFIVQAGNLSTLVLGTEFNVEAYDDEQVIKVTLQSGKVRVNNLLGNDSNKVQAILEPGQMALYTKENARLVVKPFGYADPRGWKSGRLILNDVPLEDVLQRIARKYGQAVEFDSLQAARHQHVTADYQEMGIEQVLTQLGFTFQFTVKKTENGYRIVWRNLHK